MCYSIENYIDNIYKYISLKKKELIIANNIVHSLNSNSEKAYFFKISLVDLYTKYEETLKFLFKNTINYISKNTDNNSNLNPKLIIFRVLTDLQPDIVKQKKKAERLLNIFYELQYNKNYFESFKVSDYELNFANTKHTLNILNISCENIPFNTLNNLYKNRNKIAHGDLNDHDLFNFTVDTDLDSSIKDLTKEWSIYYNCILEVLDDLSKLFIDFIENKEYLISNSESIL